MPPFSLAYGKITLRVDGRSAPRRAGATHRGTRVVVLTHDLEVRVVHAITGELL